MARETHVTNVSVEEGNERPGFGKTGAAWAISLEGKAEDGKEIQISDKAWEEMKLPIAAQAGGEEGPSSMFSRSLANSPRTRPSTMITSPPSRLSATAACARCWR